MNNQRELAKHWFLDFVRVAVAYLGLWLLLPLTWAIVALLFQPDLLNLFSTMDPADFKRIAQNDPNRIFPPHLCWIWIVGNTLLGAAAGFLVVRFGTRRSLLHALFLAVIVFATHLQGALAAESIIPRWVLAVLMSSESIAILAGGRLGFARGGNRTGGSRLDGELEDSSTD